MTTSPCSLYLSAHPRTWGSERSQLMQVYVQKSTRTTFPRRSALVSGCELSHPVAPPREGNSPSTGNGAMVAVSKTASRLMWCTRRLRRQLWQKHPELLEARCGRCH